MSLFNWLKPSSKPPAVPLPESSGLSRMDATRPANARVAEDNAQPANRKAERMARRELLYAVVREAMTHSGMLSSSYKFKVLSLDARGRQFLVMVDLARDQGDETTRLAEIEALIAQSAKARHDILVTAVYWRLNEHVAVGHPQPRHAVRHSGPMPLDSRPAPLNSMPAPLDSAPAPLDSKPAPLPSEPVPARAMVDRRFDPIDADEVAAFRLAMASGTKPKPKPSQGASARSTTDGSGKHGPQSYTLLTGFEDTELPDDNLPALGGTQYGALN